jgi:PiT family inorganic phosphate transporter
MDWFIFFLIALALIFDFINGFHDSANSVATIVSTRILSPKYAVMWAAFFNFIAFLFFGLHVAGTIGKGIVDVSIIDRQVIFGTLMGAIIWDVITWWLGLPSSSSHALIGGLIGSAVAKAGTGTLVWAGIQKTLIFIIIAPVSGFILGMVLAWIVFRLLYKASPFKVDKVFRIGQLASAAMYSLGHGGNDAQKTMGIIAFCLALVIWDRYFIFHSG